MPLPNTLFMWQKKQTGLTRLGAIFLLAYSLIIYKPFTGVDLSASAMKISTIEDDLAIHEIYPYTAGKLKQAVESPIPTSKPESNTQVASITIEKQTPTPTPDPTITPTQTPISTPTPASTEVRAETDDFSVVEVIKTHAAEYNIDANIMVAIAKCESGFRTNAVNGQYAGIFQFHPSTWQSNRRAMGLDDSTSLRFDAVEAAKTAAFKMSRDGFGAWPECSRKALLAEK